MALFVAIGLGSLAVLSYVTLSLSDRAVSRQSEARVRATTASSAALVKEELVGGVGLVKAYAGRRLLAAAIAERDAAGIRRHLDELQAARPTLTTTFVADAEGILLDIVPPTPAIVGQSFAFRDWYQGVTERNDSYVSEAYTSRAAGAPIVVGVATPVRDASGRTIGILVGGHAVSAIQAFVDTFAQAQSVRMTVTDQRGKVLARPGGADNVLEDVAARPGVGAALAGRFSITSNDKSVSGHAPVEGFGWTVTARVPRSSVFSLLADLRRGVLTIAGLLGLVVLGGAAFMGRALRRAADAEAALRRNSEELAAARDEALEANRLKSTFLANMSHEIRTPMSGVMGMTSLLRDTELDARQRDYVGTIRTSSDALLTVINDILDFSKIEAGRLDIEEIDFELASVVEEVGEVVGAAARRKTLELTLEVGRDVPEYVRGDPGRIRQVLTNLLSNAIKFTENGTVDVCVQPEGADVRFTVRDSGIGIDEEQLRRLFDPFRQGDASTTRRYGGTGLGLTISRQLVELMGGRIEVESRIEEGSVFSFVLPLAPGVGPATVTAPAELRGAQVLVVDDNAVNRRVFTEMLLAWAAVPEAFESPVEALARFRERAAVGQGFDAVLLDFLMPPMDGLELTRKLRQEPRGGDVPIVLLSSSADEEPERVRAAGVDLALSKPVRRTSLYNALAQVLGRVQEAAEETRPTAAAGPSAHVLVVDDNAVNQRIMVYMLEKHGHRADVAANGLEALTALALAPYDLVLMDCQMPEMDGFEATAEIRRREGDHRVPIVASTASAMREEVERCFAAGMDDVLPKPVREEDLVDAVRRWVPSSADPQEGADAPDASAPTEPPAR